MKIKRHTMGLMRCGGGFYHSGKLSYDPRERLFAVIYQQLKGRLG